MTALVNTMPSPNVNHPVDFGFYSSASVTLLQTTIGQINIPYGLTALNGSLTTPASAATPFSITVSNASTFIGGSGSNLAGTAFAGLQSQYPVPLAQLYIYTSATNWVKVGYTVGPGGQPPITGNTFNYCFILDGYNGGTSLTFANATAIYDPRWATHQLPLTIAPPTSVTFDAIDSQHLGLPNSKNANIISFHWDFGNGTQADGPVVETDYWYTGQLNYPTGGIAAPTEIMVTLTAVDIKGNIYYVSHPVIFSKLYTAYGAELTPGYLDQP